MLLLSLQIEYQVDICVIIHSACRGHARIKMCLRILESNFKQVGVLKNDTIRKYYTFDRTAYACYDDPCPAIFRFYKSPEKMVSVCFFIYYALRGG